MTIIRNILPQYAAKMDERVAAALDEAADSIAESAKMRVPVDSGKLRNAIHTEQVSEMERAVVAGDDEAFYGHMVEHGTSHSPPHPFLIPAFEANKAEVEKRIKAALSLLGRTG